MGGAVDDNTIGLQMGACLIDIIDLIGQMPEMTAVRRQALIPVPIIGQLYRAFLLIRRAEEDQAEPPTLIVDPAFFYQPQQLLERHGFFQIQNPDHRV